MYEDAILANLHIWPTNGILASNTSTFHYDMYPLAHSPLSYFAEQLHYVPSIREGYEGYLTGQSSVILPPTLTPNTRRQQPMYPLDYATVNQP